MGEHVTVKLPQLEPLDRSAVADDLLFIGDHTTGELKSCKVSDLPFGTGGGGGGSDVYLGSPFKVRNTDEILTQTESPAGKFNTVITDLRLLGKTDYPVNTTQLNNSAFRDGEIEYDSLNGKVTIKNFLLKDGEFITLYPDGIPQTPSTNADFATLIEKLELFEMILAPFIPTVTGANGGAIPFFRPFNEIPIGWEEVVEARGRTLVGLDTSIDEFKTVGLSGGKRLYKLTIGQLPKFSFKYLAPAGNGSATGNKDNHPDGPLIERQTETIGNDEDINGMNPFRIVHYIRFVGI